MAALKDNINEMIRNLKDTTRKNTEQDWLKTNLAKFTRMLQGQRDLLSVGKQILSELSPLVNAQHSVFFVVDNSNDEIIIKLLASYAYKERKHVSTQLKVGESLVGQCVLEKERILLTDVPRDYIKVNSGLGEHAPLNIVVLPVVFEGEVKAVIELGAFSRFTDVHLSFLEQLTESIGIVLNTITATMRTEDLLKQSQSLTEELRSQQEELTETNKRLEQQAQNLQQSEELLKEQQRELQEANEALGERAEQLALQNTEVEEKNREVETAKKMLEEKAEQLALTSKFKSEFLANMSHELRTPLNSLLILAEILTENDEENLTSKQLEYIETIHSSGTDLLDLINDILDLAKIESGTMSVDIDNITFGEIRDFVTRTFEQIADSKGLSFNIEVDPQLPIAIHTDSKRLQQVLKNLLSNAFKFTSAGWVNLKVTLAESSIHFAQDTLNQANMVVGFIVSDTGIGIPKEKHQIIFEAFQQADGTTNRKYGGTGLGLSISRQIAHMLGGEIHLESSPNEGSIFALYLPITYTPLNRRGKSLFGKGENSVTNNFLTKLTEFSQMQNALTVERYDQEKPEKINEEESTQSEVFTTELARVKEHGDDDTRPLVFIVDDDLDFITVLQEAAAEQGFRAIVLDRAVHILPLARELKPVAILLNVSLHEGNGWIVLDRLKHDLTTQHLPVHMFSREGSDSLLFGRKMGASSTLSKIISSEQLTELMLSIQSNLNAHIKKIWCVTQDENTQQTLGELFQLEKIEVEIRSTVEDLLFSLENVNINCLILDLKLGVAAMAEILEQIMTLDAFSVLPIFVLDEEILLKKKNNEIAKLLARANIHNVQSLDELFIKSALFLHLPFAELPPKQQRLLETSHRMDSSLRDKKVLIIDDDIRNIFALTSALERYSMKILFAENGKAGIDLLQKNPDIQIILMDIMMPEMDGYETIRHIRNLEQFQDIPIIALTAKAMKDDRGHSLAAGASEYLTKPVDTAQLLSTLRIWLNRPLIRLETELLVNS